MPINRGGGIRGSGGILGIPGDRFARTKPFRSQPFDNKTRFITGTTKDSTGAALGSCTVQLFRTADDSFQSEITSDGSGNFSFTSPGQFTYYIVAYKAGAPDVAGTTVNTLVGV